MVAFCVPPTGDLAHNPGMCPDWESNQRPFALRPGPQSTEPHQPGPHVRFLFQAQGAQIFYNGLQINLPFVLMRKHYLYYIGQQVNLPSASEETPALILLGCLVYKHFVKVSGTEAQLVLPFQEVQKCKRIVSQCYTQVYFCMWNQ